MADRRFMSSSFALFTLQTFLFLGLFAAFATSRHHHYDKGYLEIHEDFTWPSFTFLGQIPGISADGDGNLHIFHRGNRVWNENTFDDNNVLKTRKDGPIPNDTIIVVDTSTGRILYSWGADTFYMPHGITIDEKGNSWVTDVGLHQVFKFPARESSPILTLGKAFVPGSDKHHFCKPADVAVARSGHFFVADGYCNSRIVMFDPFGVFIGEIGASDHMAIPHSLTLISQLLVEAICVADRENKRILCYTSGLDGNAAGVPLTKMYSKERIFAIDRRGDQIFAVNGPDLAFEDKAPQSGFRGFVLDLGSNIPRAVFGPEKGFDEPHDLTVTPDENHVFVAEIDTKSPRRIYKFNITTKYGRL